ncbi:MAG: hypothetical protein QOD41_2702 [Cryptosporangiaceae bacterium]|nr:hypothetical protein [Cryptosporangiaceae bacterium]
MIGVDACKTGWIGVVLDAGVDAGVGGGTEAIWAPDLAGLAALAGPVAVLAVDIPIGLPDAGVRSADLLARLAVGPRRSSVFATPVRAAIEAPTHAEAIAVARRLTGSGVSAQAYGLRAKILDADTFVRASAVRVAEVHPEVTFAQLAGGPLAHRKTSWAGVELRRALLRSAGIELGGDLGPAGVHGAVDDVLDAAAAAWTARRIAHGEAISRPDPPEFFSDGIPAAIWT